MVGQVPDLQLSDQLAEFRDSVRAYAREHLAEQAAAADAQARFPAAAVRKAGELGFLAIAIPREHGGSERGNLASCVMLEEINAGCASTGVTISVHNSLFCSPLAKWGSEDQKQRYFPKLVTGEWLGAYCLSEAGAGSDAAGLRCEARPHNGGYLLNGAKLWTTTGSEASVFLVFARTSPERVKGISAFLVEKSSPGLSVGKRERKLGIRASPTTEILLENVEVPLANRLGEEGNGFSIALDTLDGGRLGIASQSLGIARASLELLVERLGEVNAKGRPTSSQATRWQVADLAADLDAYRFLTWRAATLRDRGERCTMETAMAKLASSRLCNRAARTAVKLLGASSAAAARYLRDARITEIYEGVTDIQRLVISRDLPRESLNPHVVSPQRGATPEVKP